MEEATTTLLDRIEEKGDTYPLWIERFLLLCIPVLTFYIGPVIPEFSGGMLGLILGWVIFPIFLLACCESIGRLIQAL